MVNELLVSLEEGTKAEKYVPITCDSDKRSFKRDTNLPIVYKNHKDHALGLFNYDPGIDFILAKKEIIDFYKHICSCDNSVS